MDDMKAFDQQLASVVLQRVGPSHPVNDAAIFTAVTATKSPNRRFQSMFSATKSAVAGAVLALFGGFLLTGVLTQSGEEPVPAAVTDTPEPTTMLLAGVDLVSEEVEPGIYRVLSDGVRDLTRTGQTAFDMQRIYAGPDGSIWTLWDDLGEGIPDRVEGAAYRIGSAKNVEGLHPYYLDDLEPWLEGLTGVVAEGSATTDVGTRWTVEGESWGGEYDALVRRDATGSSRYAQSDELPIDPHRIHRWDQFLPTSPDGAVWLRLKSEDRNCGGIGSFDGTTLTRFLRDMCVYALDVDPTGFVWLIAGHDGGLGPMHEGLIEGPFETYVITPEAVMVAE